MLSRTLIEKYFVAEKQESLVFLVLGAIAVIVALLGWLFYKTPFWKGMAIPFLLTGCVQLAAGYVVYTRSDNQRIENVYALDMNPQQLKQKELPRMQRVVKNFATYRWVEIVLLLMGLGLFFYVRNDPEKQFWAGWGLALVIEALLFFAGDTIGFKRAQEYTDALTAFVSHLP